MLIQKKILGALIVLILPLSIHAKDCYKDSDCNNWEESNCACGVNAKCSSVNWNTMKGKCECAGSSGNGCSSNSSTQSVSSASKYEAQPKKSINPTSTSKSQLKGATRVH